MTARYFIPAAPGPNDARVVVLDRRHSMREIAQLVAGGGTLDTVNVRRPVEIVLQPPLWSPADGFAETCPPAPIRLPVPAGCVMIVDDTGLIDGKPRNELASQVYAAQCRPGFDAIIAGDAFICPDEDFA